MKKYLKNFIPWLILVSVVLLLVIALGGRSFSLGWWRETSQKQSRQKTAKKKTVNLQGRAGFQLIPQYVDLAVGDTFTIIKADGEKTDIRIAFIEVESAALSCPRTRVDLEVGKRTYAAYCGMKEPRSGGIAPVEIDGIKVGVEATRLLFSRIKGGSSHFNTYEALRLRNDVRLAVWDASRGTMPGVRGRFVVDQAAWSRDRFGNWLHKTSYGIHSAIDIFATTHNVPEKVRSPVKGTVHSIYNRDGSPEDSRRSKAVNMYGDAVVGPAGEKVLYRFFHFSKVLVSVGQSVQPGQVIGLTGHTGFDPSIGDHLHFEVRLNPSHFGLRRKDGLSATIPVNPYYYLLEWRDAE